ncbi:hypothetical protein [Janthinobacterium sp.]|uniref:hypothetical protein n=1 Tax=Janthinobacterium sp. TaxID=1871054 RepID=UPI002DBFD536|nr:hypothetical protein [Janthinobacterium sp.]HEU4818331.1 hypothetical protein [Janthinobacterium sp.]
MSERTSFKRDVQGLFSRYVADMNKVKLSNPASTGVQRLYLNDYVSVKAFAWQIQVAIHGYDYDSRNEKWLVDAHHRLRKPGGGEGQYVMSAPHPMPPDGRMPQEGIDIFDQWVRDGMQP